MGKRILVIGGGGREHALVWKLAQSPDCAALYCAPGNGGIAALAQCVDLAAEDGKALAHWARQESIDLAVIGPEAALAAGVSDVLRADGIRVFGPSQAAAKIESSKIFARTLAARAGIPAPGWHICADLPSAEAYIQAAPREHLVIKQDGLAAGKGVVVAENKAQALAAARESFANKGQPLLVEERLAGDEVSFFALACGRRALAFGHARDYKRAGAGDSGANTGGMGAVSPAPAMTGHDEQTIMAHVIMPALAALADDGTPFYGVLYAGLMRTAKGFRLIEFNARFGDPECQLLMLRLESDVLPLLAAIACETLPPPPVWRGACALNVMMAAKGYPAAYQSGETIRGLAQAEAPPDLVAFHSGTKRAGDAIVSAGGRVVSLNGLGQTYAAARALVYDGMSKINWPGGFYRPDIGENLDG